MFYCGCFRKYYELRIVKCSHEIKFDCEVYCMHLNLLNTLYDSACRKFALRSQSFLRKLHIKNKISLFWLRVFMFSNYLDLKAHDSKKMVIEIVFPSMVRVETYCSQYFLAIHTSSVCLTTKLRVLSRGKKDNSFWGMKHIINEWLINESNKLTHFVSTVRSSHVLIREIPTKKVKYFIQT